MLKTCQVFLEVQPLGRQECRAVEPDQTIERIAALVFGLAQLAQVILIILDIAKLARQLAHANHPMGMHDRHTFHQVGQLPHVTRPIMLTQRHDGRGTEPDRATLLGLEAGNQLVQQQRQVFDTLAHGGHIDGEHVKAVIEVLTEGTLFDHLLQILVRRCNHPHVGALHLVAAHTLEGTLLQHPQQLYLHRQRHVAYLVKKQGSTLSQLETPGPAGNGAGEGALLVSEQFAFQQLGRNGSAVDRHERRVLTARMVMQVTGDHFLARPRFTQNQYRGLGVSHLLHHLTHRLN